MSKIFLVIIGTILIGLSCLNDPDSPPAGSEEIAADSNSNKYICGFAGSFPFTDIQPLAGVSSGTDSIIEHTFSYLWHNIIGGRKGSLEIKKDANQNTTSYKYAAAKGGINIFGYTVREIYYKSNDLAPLLTKDNGWQLRVIALHELGHHINGDPFTGVSRDTAELGADDYAGFISARESQTTLDTILLAFTALTEEYPTNGYPNRERRIAAVKTGWERGLLSGRNSLVATFVRVKGTRRGFYYTDKQFDHSDLRNAIEHNRNEIQSLKDTSTTGLVKVGIEASASPGKFYIDSNYLYFKNSASLSIVGKVARSNRDEYTQMVYDSYYNYMYIDSTNTLITYIIDRRDPQKRLMPVVIGHLSKPND
jgi:hypothetical protein